MKKLVKILKEIDDTLLSLDEIIRKEYIILLNSKTDVKKLSDIISKKHDFLNKLNNLKKTQLYLEKTYNVFPPYAQHTELNYFLKKIINKCILLNKRNYKNKILIKHKFYLNQTFLNFYKSFNKKVTYDLHGN
ncbi:flagellar export chaperone FlgN [Buchnera aphidicola (Aphis aurantii)]|uniref:flagellar export chaperone FlgN n=1 Tax=Buchnera aphidicola TaxID=9 RepID=UPI0031B73DF6